MPKRIFIKDGGLTSSVPTPAGYTVIGADNGTPKKQVQSTISNIGLPYKIYTALLTQSGTASPVATVLENTLSGTPVWSYDTVGYYKLTLANEFTPNKTVISISYDNTVIAGNSVVNITSYQDVGVADYIWLESRIMSVIAGALDITYNNSLVGTYGYFSITIKVYP